MYSRAFRIDGNCIEAHKYHYLYLLCKEGNYTDVSFKIDYMINYLFIKKAQQAFNHLLQAIDISEPKGAWQYYEISQVVARVV
jgi:hypothetical protein